MGKRDIEFFLTKCKIAANFKFITVWKQDSKETIAALGYTMDDVKEEILNLELIDYVEGPGVDRDGYGGDFYIFGKIIHNREIYIKVKVKSLNDEGNRQLNLLCMSFHFAKCPLTYPFKQTAKTRN